MDHGGTTVDAGTVVAVGVHEFPDEVLVEVTLRDGDGDLVVTSFQFDRGADGSAYPVAPVSEDLEPVVSDALAEEGYEYTAEQVA